MNRVAALLRLARGYAGSYDVVVVGVCFFSLAFHALPLATAFKFADDEGCELMKALLVARNHSLYSEIWTDQPPLLTLLLSRVVDGSTEGAFRGRLIILTSATLLISSFYYIVRSQTCRLTGIIAVSLLATSFLFLRMAGSVIPELPAVGLALCSLALLRWALKASHGQGLSTLGVYVSGFTFGLALQCKLTALSVIPAVCGLWLFPGVCSVQPGCRAGLWGTASRWFCGLIAATVLIWIVAPGEPLGSLIEFHLSARSYSHFPNRFEFASLIVPLVFYDYPLLLAACGAFVLVGFRGIGNQLYMLWWFGAVLLALLVHKPYFNYYYVHVAIPLSYLAAVGAVLAGRLVTTIRYDFSERVIPWSRIALAIWILFTLALAAPKRIYRTLAWTRTVTGVAEQSVISQIRSFGFSVTSAYADEPIVPFYLGISMPPELAALSMKRLRVCGLNAEEIGCIVKVRRPDLLILSLRFDYSLADFLKSVSGDYEFAWRGDGYSVFKRVGKTGVNGRDRTVLTAQ